ncbi:flavin reductase like domain-containing protein [Mycena amicta]|nr:flavin reductase like domain-containing protein [Mycena amicta]
MRKLLPTFIRPCSSTTASSTKGQLRVLLRETAQPVAVVTSFMPGGDEKTRFHGATLSSFTSIALDPDPLVTFALRIPSRMSIALNAPPSHLPSDMVINLLSADQASVAARFSRVDLYPHPFDSTDYFLTADGLPVIRGSLGALSCKLVSRGLPLHDRRLLEARRFDLPAVDASDSQVVSQLFIARVTRVEELGLGDDEKLPLLYHRRKYGTTRSG